MNVSPGPNVDIVGSCHNLSQFADNSIEEIYASHVFEHLGLRELHQALTESLRVLRPEGKLWIAVPDMDVLCQMYLNKSLGTAERIELTRIIYGGQMNEHDFHKTGLNYSLLMTWLEDVGFSGAERKPTFGIFADRSNSVLNGRLISLNVVAYK
jgi:predicted SAM-dependent methyltransferase